MSRRQHHNKLVKLFRNESSYQSDEVALLIAGLDQMELTSKNLVKSSESEKRGIEAIAAWAKRSRNSAIDDVMQQTAQLFQMYAEKQKQFARDHNHFIQQLKKIAEVEHRVREYEKHLCKKEQRVEAIRKQITRSSFFWCKSTAEMAALRRVEDEAAMEAEKARRRLQAAQEEAEVIKMFLFRQGMMGLADSYRVLNEHTRAIFDCHREITELVPAVAAQRIDALTYEGSPHAHERLAEVRRAMETEQVRLRYNPPAFGGRRAQADLRRSVPSFYQPGTPPPPYSEETPAALGFPVSSFSDSHIRRLNAGVRLGRSSASVSRAQPTAPEATPHNSAIPSHPRRLYPDLTAELRGL